MFYSLSLTVVQMTDILAGSYFRVYSKLWLSNVFRKSGDTFTSSLCGAMGTGFIC